MSRHAQAQLLEDSADLLERNGWVRHLLHNGHFLLSEYASNPAHCAMGAMLAVDSGDQQCVQFSGRTEAFNGALSALADYVLTQGAGHAFNNRETIAHWNNDLSRTAEEVVDAMRLTAKDLRNGAEPEEL